MKKTCLNSLILIILVLVLLIPLSKSSFSESTSIQKENPAEKSSLMNVSTYNVWQSVQITNTSTVNECDAYIKTDPSGNIAMLWKSPFDGWKFVYASEKNGWEKEVVYDGGIHPRALCFDVAGNAHTAFWLVNSTGIPSIFYANNSNGSWTTTQISNYSADWPMDMTVTQDGVPIIAWSQQTESLNYDINLAYLKSDGSWIYQKLTDYDGTDTYTRMDKIIIEEIDGQVIVHMTWREITNYVNEKICHATNQSSIWEKTLVYEYTGPEVLDDIYSINFIRTPNGSLHLFWILQGIEIFHSRNISGSWESYSIYSSNSLNTLEIVLDEQLTFHGCFVDDTSILYLNYCNGSADVFTVCEKHSIPSITLDSDIPVIAYDKVNLTLYDFSDIYFTTPVTTETGVPILDDSLYETPAVANITLTDYDRNQNYLEKENITVTITSSIDQLELNLTETGLGYCNFSGSFNIVPETSEKLKDILQVKDGDVISVSYNDPLDYFGENRWINTSAYVNVIEVDRLIIPLKQIFASNTTISLVFEAKDQNDMVIEGVSVEVTNGSVPGIFSGITNNSGLVSFNYSYTPAAFSVTAIAVLEGYLPGNETYYIEIDPPAVKYDGPDISEIPNLQFTVLVIAIGLCVVITSNYLLKKT